MKPQYQSCSCRFITGIDKNDYVKPREIVRSYEKTFKKRKKKPLKPNPPKVMPKNLPFHVYIPKVCKSLRMIRLEGKAWLHETTKALVEE